LDASGLLIGGNTVTGQSRAVAVVVVLAAMLAGCSGVTPPPGDAVSVNATDGYAVSDVEVWTSGGTTAYRSKIVVTGVVASTADETRPNASGTNASGTNASGTNATRVAAIPPVDVRFTLASGESRSVQANYELDRRLTAFEDLGNATLSPGERIPVRIVFDPGGDVRVRSATVRVGANRTASAIAAVERPQ
jgi:ABC-type uncharacterized transport system auxiliary subunit